MTATHRRTVYRAGLLTLFGIASGLLAGAGPARAQMSVETRAGASFPVGDLADTADPGLGLGVTLSRPLSARFALSLEGGVSSLEERRFDPSVRSFSVTLWQVTAGLRYRLTDRAATDWKLSLGAGLGASTLDSDGFGVLGVASPLRNPRTGAVVEDLGGTFLSATGGIRVARPLTGALSLVADVRANIVFVDEDETAILPLVTAGGADPLGTTISVPVTAGLEIAF